MARGDPVYGRLEVDWPDDPRSQRLTPKQNWVYICVYLTSIRCRRSVLPASYDCQYFAKRTSTRRQYVSDTISKCCRIDPERPILFFLPDGRICVPGAGLRNEKLEWKDERAGVAFAPYGDDKGPIQAPLPSFPPSLQVPTSEKPRVGKKIEAKNPKKRRRKAAAQTDYCPEFVVLWNAYPRRTDKQGGYEVCQVRLGEGASWKDMAAAARHYGQAMIEQQREPQHIKHAATFYGPKNHWKEWVKGVPEGEQPAATSGKDASETIDWEALREKKIAEELELGLISPEEAEDLRGKSRSD